MYGNFPNFDPEEVGPAELETLFDHFERIAKAIRGYMEHEFRSLDDALGVRRPDNYHQAAARRRFLHMRRLQDDGRVLRERGAVVDAQFFEYLARRHNVGKTTASEWYYQAYKGLRPDPTKSNSDISEQIRAQLNWKA